jgi:2-methylcitrate dehydratase PrpD
LVKNRLEDIEQISIRTHESAIRIIDKTGPLHNPADRDHCIQYMVAIGVLFGELTAEHYEDATARDLRIDALRAKMVVQEEPRYSQEYLEPEKRSIANAIQIFFNDGSFTEKIEVEYPIGHRRRRKEGIPLLVQKFEANLKTQFSTEQATRIMTTCENVERLSSMPVNEFVDLFLPQRVRQ